MVVMTNAANFRADNLSWWYCKKQLHIPLQTFESFQFNLRVSGVTQARQAMTAAKPLR